ncbi:MAG: CopG family ribbon-helix-helix protein [Nanoarchaeota archaeon]|nr:CopG family ribbon-helix-helix protein [Nanoarchaeota archaeon]
MGIISISVNEKTTEDMETLQKEMGFSGRSEVVRAGIRSLMSEQRERSRITGNAEGVIILAHDEENSEQISEIRHKYHEVKTQIHNHMGNHKCLQIFIVEGEADRIRSLLSELESSKKIDFCKMLLP